MTKQEVVEFTKNSIENSIIEDEELYDTNIDFILINPNNNDTISIISDGQEKIIEFTPYTKEMKTGYSHIAEWDYNFDDYLFQELEKGYEIGYMSIDNHYGIWNSIEELYPEDINYKDGVQMYLQYCVDNGITKQYLDRKTSFDTPNIMKYFKGLTLNDTIEYREDLESEKAYFTFVLGYDLLNEMLSKSSSPENDISYDFCNMIASEFLKSEEYKNEKYSAYEILDHWICKNRKYIIKSYKDFIEEKKLGKTRQLDDGMYVIDIGYRNNQEPIALVEKTNKDNSKEYIVAFYYSIKDNKINWGYGYYYDNDIQKAKKDFNKVLNGENLSLCNFKERNSYEQDR